MIETYILVLTLALICITALVEMMNIGCRWSYSQYENNFLMGLINYAGWFLYLGVGTVISAFIAQNFFNPLLEDLFSPAYLVMIYLNCIWYWISLIYLLYIRNISKTDAKLDCCDENLVAVFSECGNGE